MESSAELEELRAQVAKLSTGNECLRDQLAEATNQVEMYRARGAEMEAAKRTSDAFLMRTVQSPLGPSHKPARASKPQRLLHKIMKEAKRVHSSVVRMDQSATDFAAELAGLRQTFRAFTKAIADIEAEIGATPYDNQGRR